MSDPERSAANTAQLVKTFKDNWPVQVELETMMAKMTRIRYLAYIQEGFTEAQALDLCKTWKG